MTQTEEAKHTEGPRWKIVRRCKTYAEADLHRNGLLTETDTMQVKIHVMGPRNSQFFAVKTRLDPAKAPPESPKKNKRKKR